MKILGQCKISKGTRTTSRTDFTHCFGVSIVDFEQVNTRLLVSIYPGNIYLFKLNNGYSRERYEICSKLTIKIPERLYWRRSNFFFFFCYFWTNLTTFSTVSTVEFKQVTVSRYWSNFSFAALYVTTFTLTFTEAVYCFDGHYYHSLSTFIFLDTDVNTLQ